jgi:hypothetical protein
LIEKIERSLGGDKEQGLILDFALGLRDYRFSGSLNRVRCAGKYRYSLSVELGEGAASQIGFIEFRVVSSSRW